MKRITCILSLLVVAFAAFAQQAKYVFYFIGDGMGANQVLLTEMYLAETGGEIGRKQLTMTTFPYSGQIATFSASNSITDSSAAGTCLATGRKTTNGMLGVTPEGEPVKSIAQILHDAGWAVGVTTSVSIDHATPGAFYAHVGSRGDYYEIGRQLTETDYEFFGGSSFLEPISNNDPDLPSLYELCDQKGYTIARGMSGMQALGKHPDKVILVQDHEAQDKVTPSDSRLPFAIDKNEKDLTLPQITGAAIRTLRATDRPFFLMVEGGAIDWACHGNDAATTIHEVIEFDEAIQVAYRFYLDHPDETLIVVTADHETGGCALGNHKYTLNLRYLQYQQMSAGKLSEAITALRAEYGKRLKYDQVRELFSKYLGLYTEVPVSAADDAALQATFKAMMRNKTNDTKTLYDSLNALADQAVCLLNTMAHVAWTTHSHSASAVPVFAIGAGAEKFSGWHDNGDIMPLIYSLTH